MVSVSPSLTVNPSRSSPLSRTGPEPAGSIHAAASDAFADDDAGEVGETAPAGNDSPVRRSPANSTPRKKPSPRHAPTAGCSPSLADPNDRQFDTHSPNNSSPIIRTWGQRGVSSMCRSFLPHESHACVRKRVRYGALGDRRAHPGSGTPCVAHLCERSPQTALGRPWALARGRGEQILLAVYTSPFQVSWWTPEPCQHGTARGGITTSLQQPPGQPVNSSSARATWRCSCGRWSLGMCCTERRGTGNGAA